MLHVFKLINQSVIIYQCLYFLMVVPFNQCFTDKNFPRCFRIDGAKMNRAFCYHYKTEDGDLFISHYTPLRLYPVRFRVMFLAKLSGSLLYPFRRYLRICAGKKVAGFYQAC